MSLARSVHGSQDLCYAVWQLSDGVLRHFFPDIEYSLLITQYSLLVVYDCDGLGLSRHGAARTVGAIRTIHNGSVYRGGVLNMMPVRGVQPGGNEGGAVTHEGWLGSFCQNRRCCTSFFCGFFFLVMLVGIALLCSGYSCGMLVCMVAVCCIAAIMLLEDVQESSVVYRPLIVEPLSARGLTRQHG